MKEGELEKQLTAKEREILNLLGLGKALKVIASDLKITTPTLNTHLKSIRLKTRIFTLNGLGVLGFKSNFDKNENK